MDKTDKHVRRLAQLVDELEAVEVVVGLPRTLADRSGPSARDAIELAEQLARRIAPTPVRLADERLTTVSAQRSLREAGVRAKGQRRDDRSGCGGRDLAELAGPAARGHDRARRGRGWLTTGAANAQNPWRSDRRGAG